MKTRCCPVGCAVLGAACSLALTGAARADDETEVTYAITASTDNGWTYYPATQGGSVRGVLAVQTGGAPAPSGFGVVWYARQSDGSFTMFGYTGGALAAAQALCAQADDSALFAHSGLWLPGEAPPELPGEAGEFVATLGGIADSDPVSGIAPFLTGEEIEFLVSTGAAGAASLSAMEAEEPCEDTGDSAAALYLAHLATLFETAVGTEPGAPDLAALASSDGVCGLCWPEWITSTVTVQGPWSFVSLNAGGGCAYNRDVVTSTTTCYVTVTCTITSCSTTTTTTTKSRTCPSVGGGCAGKPSC